MSKKLKTYSVLAISCAAVLSLLVALRLKSVLDASEIPEGEIATEEDRYKYKSSDYDEEEKPTVTIIITYEQLRREMENVKSTLIAGGYSDYYFQDEEMLNMEPFALYMLMNKISDRAYDQEMNAIPVGWSMDEHNEPFDSEATFSFTSTDRAKMFEEKMTF